MAHKNLELAYATMQALEQKAKDAGLHCSALISSDDKGELYFKVEDIGGELGKAFLKGFDTTDEAIFQEKIAAFDTYWSDLMKQAKETHAVRIAELKEELAKLEGRA